MRELRVHGVGGPQEEGLLGVRSADDVHVVALGEGTRVIRRAAEPAGGVEGYSWGGLTSSSANTAGWLLYLPFTLLNAAGWAAHRGWRGRVHSWLSYALALTATATYVLWSGYILLDLVGWQWRSRLRQIEAVRSNAWLDGAVEYAMPVIAGLVFVALIGALFVLMIRRSPTGRLEDDGGTWKQDESFNPLFYRHRAKEKVWGLVHLGVAVACIVGVFVTMYLRHDQERLFLGHLVLGAGLAQGLVVGAIWIVALLQPRARPVGAAMATLGAVMANAAFAGAALLAIRVLSGFPGVPEHATDVPVRGGPELGLTGVFLVSIVLGLVVALLAVVHLLTKPIDALDLPAPVEADLTPLDRDQEPIVSRSPLATDEVDELSPQMRARVIRMRRFARLTHCAHLPVCFLAGVFVLGGVAYAIACAVQGKSPFDHDYVFHPERWPQWAGAIVLTALPVLTALALRRTATSASDRRALGVAWDVTLIWPRRYHPLAVPPYAAQATDELQSRLLFDLERQPQGPILLAAHSQGTALAFITLRSLVEAAGDAGLTRVWLLTYGSHLNGLYAVAFPRHFNRVVFDDLRCHLDGWCNFWRRTDPIGGPIRLGAHQPYLGDLLPGDEQPEDVICPDPPVKADGPDLASPNAPLERNRPPWLDLSIHSWYRAEPLVKAWVAAVPAGNGAQG